MRQLSHGRLTEYRGGVLAATACCAALLLAFVVGAEAQAAQIESQQAFGFTHSAKLEAAVDPQGTQTTCAVQYAGQSAFSAGGWASAATAPCEPEDLGDGSSAVSVSARIDGLSLGETYDYRFVATSNGVSTFSANETFTTFGLESFAVQALNAEGQPFSQAGGHPYELVTTLELNASYTSDGRSAKDASLKDVRVQLPPGLIGSPAATPHCLQRLEEEYQCPVASQVGTIAIGLMGDAGKGQVGEGGSSPLFNLVPPQGMAARFGAVINGGISAYINAGVRSGSDYGVDAGSLNISQWGNVKRIVVRMWGVPSDARHDSERNCPKPVGDGFYEECTVEVQSKPFISMPTACEGPLSASGAVDSYQAVGEFSLAKDAMPEVTGCGLVGFAPSFEARPLNLAADSPTGLAVDLRVPPDQSPEGLASADLKNATITFPPGLVVDPSSADGLEGCSEAQIGFTGFAELQKTGEPGVQTPQFSPGPAECPDAAKLGSVQVNTPLLEHPLTGGMYLAKQRENPFGSLLAVYLTLYDPISGVVIKLPGLLQANPSTGQLTATFDQNPQLPFEDLKVSLFEGTRAPLTTPSTCGSYTTDTELVPWSSPEAPSAAPSSSFAVSEGAGGGGCVGSEAQAPNTPGFEAGTASPVAGSFSPFVLKLTREDGSQRFAALNVTLPPGLIGKVAGVEECPQGDIEAAQRRDREGEGAAELASPSCPAGSELGVVHVGAGSGAPMHVTGRAYFAGPYEGAPFSLAIVTPAVAGPFDLGVVVVRAGLFINPLTAQVTVKSDPFPSIVDGIPLDIRTVQVDVSRPGFILNPTSCEATAVTGQETSTVGQTAALSDRFQAGGCTNLPFKPSLEVSASGKVSHLDGTSVQFRLSYPPGALGREAWLRAAKFEFPKQLSARFGTIQKSCPAATFAANPAGCPGPAVIGTATVKSQLLPVALSGPVYFVSNGSAKFPEAVFVLQGDGVTVDLHSETFINEKTGVTSATLPAIPGVPFEEATVTLPAGPYSEFTGIGNLCKPTRTIAAKKKVTVRSKGHTRRVTRTVKETVTAPLVMPTGLIGQNGATASQNTPVTITECPKAKTAGKQAGKKSKKHGKRKDKGGASGRAEKAGYAGKSGK
jgi:hypothetical protein